MASTEVVERHIERIVQVNPRLNAVVRTRFDEARLEAKQADERVRRAGRGPLPPLLGVPCTVKESIALGGMPWSSGVVARSGEIAREDAPPVARLRAAGAIPLGVTNVPELTAWMATFNRVYGRTSNAYDPRRMAGGSSGGEGAIVAAGGSPFGVGTDIGGSIRIPAFCNGVFGHKPTGGLVPGTGQFPAYAGAHCRINTTGPIARRAEDLMPLLRILAGPDGVDPGCREVALGDPASVDVSRLRVLVVEGDGLRPGVTPELRRAQQRAAYALARRGARVDAQDLPGLRRSFAIVAGLQLEEGRSPLPADLGDGERASLGREIVRLALGRSRHTYPPLLGSLAVRVALRFPSWLGRNAARGRELRDRIEELLGDDAVMLYPSALGPAPLHGRSVTGLTGHFRFTGLLNVLELPATQVPLGLGEAGLPLGVQVVGARGRDHVTIAVATALERALGGWVPPGTGAKAESPESGAS